MNRQITTYKSENFNTVLEGGEYKVKHTDDVTKEVKFFNITYDDDSIEKLSSIIQKNAEANIDSIILPNIFAY